MVFRASAGSLPDGETGPALRSAFSGSGRVDREEGTFPDDRPDFYSVPEDLKRPTHDGQPDAQTLATLWREAR
jgi:hypothetical protein